jgi:hypothetical protein
VSRVYTQPLAMASRAHARTLSRMDELVVRHMTDAEFSAFRERAIRQYAASHVRAGNWSPELAEELAARETDGLLPEEPHTAGMLLLVAETAANGWLAWCG